MRDREDRINRTGSDRDQTSAHLFGALGRNLCCAFKCKANNAAGPAVRGRMTNHFISTSTRRSTPVQNGPDVGVGISLTPLLEQELNWRIKVTQTLARIGLGGGTFSGQAECQEERTV
jgi:hypothetical protein